MTNLKQTALEYSSIQILNIADLKEVSIELDVKEESDCEFPYKFIEIEGKKYRVPASVLINLKAMLEDNPNMEKFRVKKSGEGMNTSYTVIPLL